MLKMYLYTFKRGNFNTLWLDDICNILQKKKKWHTGLRKAEILKKYKGILNVG